MASELPPTGQASSDTALPRAGYLLLAALTLFWGSNWPVMKIVLAELPVWWFRSFCLVAGSLGLLLITRLSRQSLRVPRREWAPLLFCALFNIVGWHLCSAYGVSLIPAGRAVIIAFTMPVWAALLGKPFLDEPITKSKLAGLVLGIAGLAVLIGPDLAVFGTAPRGALFMLLAAISWAVGLVALKRFTWSLPTSTLVGWQMLAGAVPVTAGALILEAPPAVGELSTAVLFALAYIIAFPMLFCHWAFYKTVRLFPAGIAAIGTLAIPVVGVYSSAWALGESAGLRELSALTLICAALAVVLLNPAVEPNAAGR